MRLTCLKIFVIVLVILAGLVGTSTAAEYWLRTGAFTKTMPDTTQITMWGYALVQYNIGAGVVAGDNVLKAPGPTITVPPGDGVLTIHLTNNLPGPTSIVIPGQSTTMSPTWTDGTTGSRTNLTQRVRSLTHEGAAGGGTANYTWTNLQPGTYLYQSGTNQQVQVPMGLYGAVKKDAAVGQAYAGVNYAEEAVILFSEIDPAINNAVATGTYGPGQAVTSTIGYTGRYFLINGTPFSVGTPPLLTGSAGQSILLRFLNAGVRDYVPVLQGIHMTLWAEDGNKLPYPKSQYSLLLPAGKTMDAIIQPESHQWVPLYDRRLALTNNAASPGGMLAYLNIGPLWISISGATPSAPALAWNTQASILQMAVRGMDNAIWVSSFSSTGAFNNDWTLISGATPDAPALAWNPAANILQMAVRGMDNSIWVSSFSSTGAFNNDWTLISGATPSAPALAWNQGANILQMAVRGMDNSIWVSSFGPTGAFNNDWTLISGATPSPPALAWNPVASILQMVVRGTDNAIWVSSFSSTGAFNNDWILTTGTTPSSPALAWNQGVNLLQIAVRGMDNSIWAALY
jgi:hypothetical protein